MKSFILYALVFCISLYVVPWVFNHVNPWLGFAAAAACLYVIFKIVSSHLKNDKNQ